MIPKVVATGCLTAVCLFVANHAASAGSEPNAALAGDDAARQLNFMPVATNYLNLLAAGRYEEAALLTDCDHAIRYLTAWRIAKLKEANPELTPEEEQILAAGLRENELQTNRIREILVGMLREQDPRGMTWAIRSVGRPLAMPDALLVTYTMKSTNGQTRDLQFGLASRGQGWFVAPYLPEQLAAMKPVPLQAGPAPQAVTEAGDRFWGFWSSGELDQAYESLAPPMRHKVPLLTFLEQIQDVLKEKGALQAWETATCYTLQSNQVDVLYHLTFAKEAISARAQWLNADRGWKITVLAVPFPAPGAVAQP